MPEGAGSDSGNRDGRVVVTTGASSGIERLAAQRFAARGDRVVLASRSEASLDEVAQECRDRETAGEAPDSKDDRPQFRPPWRG